MELHNSIYKAPLISNYAALFWSWSPIKLTHQILRSWVLWLIEASFLRPDSPQTSPWNETVKLFRRRMIVAIYPMDWSSGTWCLIWCHSWYSHSKWDGILSRINRAAPTMAFDSWETSLFVGLQRDRMGDAEGHKGNILIREYSPETMNMLGIPTAHSY